MSILIRLHDEAGQALAEYTAVLGLVSVAAMVAAFVLGSTLTALPSWNPF